MALFSEVATLSVDGVDIPGIIEMTAPEGTVDEVETTAIGDTHKEFRFSNCVEAGTWSFTVLYDSAEASHETIRGYTNSPAMAAWVLTLSNGDGFSWNGFVTSAPIGNFNRDADNVTMEVEGRVNGAVTFVPAA